MAAKIPPIMAKLILKSECVKTVKILHLMRKEMMITPLVSIISPIFPDFGNFFILCGKHNDFHITLMESLQTNKHKLQSCGSTFEIFWKLWLGPIFII